MKLPVINLKNINVKADDNIAIVSLNRSSKRNALNAETIEELNDLVLSKIRSVDGVIKTSTALVLNL